MTEADLRHDGTHLKSVKERARSPKLATIILQSPVIFSAPKKYVEQFSE